MLRHCLQAVGLVSVGLISLLSLNAGSMCQAATLYRPNPNLSFDDPTQVNLLTRWLPTGVYGLTATASHASTPLLNAIDYHRDGSAYRVNGINSITPPLTFRFTFDQPRTIDTLGIHWRVENHSPDNYTWSDQSGVIATGSMPGGFPSGTSSNTFAPRTSNYIEFSANPPNTGSGVFEIVHLSAFLAPGEVLPMDGTYNVFSQAGTFARIAGFNDLGRYTDQDEATFLTPTQTADSITWQFDRPYQFTGAYLTHLGAHELIGTTLEVSMDGVDWTTVFDPANVGTSYMIFNQPGDGRYARLSWTANSATPGSGAGRELTEFQLFGIQLEAVPPVPEPGSGLLLVLGIAGLLNFSRKRNTRREDA